MQFSVVIPTLQLSPMLTDLIHMYHAHPLVGEILVVNNATVPLAISASKLRVLDQDANIFVNPAWNLGARVARCELLAISNDDIAIDGELLDRAANQLADPSVAIIGGDLRADGPPGGRPRFARIYRRREGFGVLMMMRTTSYRPIPEELKIWQGDDYLFHQQRGHNYAFRGFRLETPHHVSAGLVEFNAQKAADNVLYMREHHGHSVYQGQRGWDFSVVRTGVAARTILRELRAKRPQGRSRR